MTATGLFLAEGPQAGARGGASPARAGSATSTSTRRPRPARRHRRAPRRAAGLRVHAVTPEVLRGDVRRRRPRRGCWRSAGSPDVPLDAGRWMPRRASWRACSANVRDPGNAGTVIRGADAAGADAVLVSDAQRRRPHPQGGALHRRLAVPPAGRHRRPESRRMLQRCAPPASAARRRRRGRPTLLHDADLDRAARLGHGQRGVGARRTTCATPATRSVRVPIHGRAESLNLAMAATVCLYASAEAAHGHSQARRWP